MTGWYADAAKKKFNLTINIVHGDAQLYQTRSASGNVGDIILFDDAKIENAVKAGLLYDMNKNDLLSEYGKDIENYQAAIKRIQKAYNTGSAVYAIPSGVSSQSVKTSSELGDLTFGSFAPFELYQAVGSPKLNIIDDVYPMLKAMHEKRPKIADGKPTYAFSIFKDWDGDGMCLATQTAQI